MATETTTARKFESRDYMAMLFESQVNMIAFPSQYYMDSIAQRYGVTSEQVKAAVEHAIETRAIIAFSEDKWGTMIYIPKTSPYYRTWVQV